MPIHGRTAWTLRGKRYEEGTVYLDFLHDYLADEADWRASTWDFEPEGLSKLRETMLLLFSRIPEAFLFQAVWIGDPVESELGIGRAEFLEIIDQDEIGTRTRYAVAADAA